MTQDKDCLLKLTLAIYRVTELFPEKEPLRYAIREAANKFLVLGLSGCSRTAEAVNLVEILKSYFVIAKTQNWAAVQNFWVLEKEYEELISIQNKSLTLETKPVQGPEIGALNQKTYNNNGKNNKILPDQRRQKIAEIVSKRTRATLRELAGELPGVHRRTLLRDLDNLLKGDKLKKEGNGRATMYFGSAPRPVQQIQGRPEQVEGRQSSGQAGSQQVPNGGPPTNGGLQIATSIATEKEIVAKE